MFKLGFGAVSKIGNLRLWKAHFLMQFNKISSQQYTEFSTDTPGEKSFPDSLS